MTRRRDVLAGAGGALFGAGATEAYRRFFDNTTRIEDGKMTADAQGYPGVEDGADIRSGYRFLGHDYYPFVHDVSEDGEVEMSLWIDTYPRTNEPDRYKVSIEQGEQYGLKDCSYLQIGGYESGQEAELIFGLYDDCS